MIYHILLAMVLVAVAHNVTVPEGMELEGMFRYTADASTFRDCRNGKSYPVSKEAQYLELERAYLDSGIETESELMVNLQGRLLSRPSNVTNINTIKLIVNSINGIYPDKTCSPVTHSDLVGTYWRLDKLNGEKIKTVEGMRETHMVLESGESRVRGFAGCNNFFGQFETMDDALFFSAMGATMMACPQGMDTEQSFLAALGATTRYKISGLFLELYADDQLLARLEAVYL